MLCQHHAQVQRLMHAGSKSVYGKKSAAKFYSISSSASWKRHIQFIRASIFLPVSTSIAKQFSAPHVDNTISRSFTCSSSPSSRVAIVGSGPAAFYTAKYLLKDYPTVNVDIFERLPVPFGLVRFGVAPDHPEVKLVQHEFQQIINDQRVQFYGNVTIGEQLLIHDLQQYYHIIVLAYGAQSERALQIEGSHLYGIHQARSLVNWYNGHPSFQQQQFNLNINNVVIVGQGNVAIDCARMLLSDPATLTNTDICDSALQIFSSSSVSHVSLLGRRGPVQSAFTTAEFREISEMRDVNMVISADELKRGEEGENLIEMNSSRPKKRKMQLIKQVFDKFSNSPASTANSKSLQMHFFTSPVAYIEDVNHKGHVGAVKVEKMRLEGVAGEMVAVGMGEFEVLPAGMILESIGYRSLPIDQLPFDNKRHIIPSDAGRVIHNEAYSTWQPSSSSSSSSSSSESNASPLLTGLYVTGWLKRGPTGIIGSNITDARETVASIVTDLSGSVGEQRRSHVKSANSNIVKDKLSEHRVVNKEGWHKIEQWENEQGALQKRPRVKAVDWQQMLQLAGV